MDFKQIDTLRLEHLTVPLYEHESNRGYMYVRYQDLPEDLTAALAKVSSRSACPAPGAGFFRDLRDFIMSGDPVAQKYAGSRILTKVDELVYRNLVVPVWQVSEPARYMMYAGQFIRLEDLPEDLRKAFNEWHKLAACPGLGKSYVHDFTDFMDRSGRGWSGDFSAVVKRYR